MRIEDFGAAGVARPWKLKYPLRETPHFTIETNKTCNICCRSCYSSERSLVKSRAEIREEVGLALAKRKAGVVTLLGGEPTLHPELPAVVADIKGRGLRCQLLTNGIRFLETGGDDLLGRLAASGLDRVLVHLDEGQAHVHPDLEAARRAVFEKLERRGLRFGLALTVYEGFQGRIPSLLRANSSYRYFDGVLAVLARDPVRPEQTGPGLAHEYDSFRLEMAAAPSAYIPSNLDDGDVRWLVYFLFFNRRTGRSLILSPRLFGFLTRLHRIIRGRWLYAPFLSRAAVCPLAILAVFAEAAGRTKALREAVSILKRSGWGRDIGFGFAVIQTPPEFRDGGREYVLCHACPDATVRNGRLTPVCIADMINPLNGGIPPRDEANRIRLRAAYGHLGEL